MKRNFIFFTLGHKGVGGTLINYYYINNLSYEYENAQTFKNQ